MRRITMAIVITILMATTVYAAPAYMPYRGTNTTTCMEIHEYPYIYYYDIVDVEEYMPDSHSIYTVRVWKCIGRGPDYDVLKDIYAGGN